jgi:hypothetical protein
VSTPIASGRTPRLGIRYLERNEPMLTTRAVLEDNARTTEDALLKVQALVAQLGTLVQPGGWAQGYIGLDTDGVPYYDPAGAVTQPAAIGIDTDLIPYVIEWTTL